MTKVDYIMCLPGNSSSRLQSLNEEIVRRDLAGMGKRVVIKHAKSCNIYTARNECMKNRHGMKRHQVPWDGEFDYDRVIWVDSDNIISTHALMLLIERDVDIVASWYKMWDGYTLGDDARIACGWWERDVGINTCRPMTAEGVMHGTYPLVEGGPANGLIEVDFSGFGLMVWKRGVAESLEYPWFRSDVIYWNEHDENGQICEYAEIDTDDVSMCSRLKQAGYQIYVHPQSRILHEKPIAI